MSASAFSLYADAIYRRPEVAATCLRLQNEEGADVNLVLYALWRAATGRGSLAVADFAAIETDLAPWRTQVTQPLRALRTTLAGDQRDRGGRVRRSVLTAELASEYAAHDLIERAMAARAGGPGGAADSMAAYAAYLGRRIDWTALLEFSRP
jgi:uncharacterized protein (TIGR02444 family)